MLKYGGTLCVLVITILCLLIDINCSTLSKEARLAHRNMEFRLNGIQNELIKAIDDIESIRDNRGTCTCPAPNTTAPGKCLLLVTILLFY